LATCSSSSASANSASTAGTGTPAAASARSICASVTRLAPPLATRSRPSRAAPAALPTGRPRKPLQPLLRRPGQLGDPAAEAAQRPCSSSLRASAVPPPSHRARSRRSARISVIGVGDRLGLIAPARDPAAATARLSPRPAASPSNW
jgi:hypothetical protein